MTATSNEDLVKRIARLAKQNQELEEEIKRLEKLSEKLLRENEKLKALSASMSSTIVKGEEEDGTRERPLRFNVPRFFLPVSGIFKAYPGYGLGFLNG
jgi:hypothetical protein